MDFIKKVESGQYGTEQLPKDDKAFVAGIDEVMNKIIDERIEGYSDILADPRESCSTMTRIMCEEAMQELRSLQEAIYVYRCEYIVDAIDTAEADAAGKPEADETA